MLWDDRPTPYDLRFRMLGTPVRVHPLFWLTMGLLGQNQFQMGFDFGFIWLAAGFFSVLLHELGHAIAIRRFGSPAAIVLLAFGGVAIPTYPAPRSRQRLLIALAGPFAGFAFLGLLALSAQIYPWDRPTVNALANGVRVALYAPLLYENLFFMNLVWNLLNLLPIYPFDGGRALRELLMLGGARRPDATTFRVSFVTALTLGIYGIITNLGGILPPVVADLIPWWARPGVIGTIFFLLLAYQSYQLFKAPPRGPRLYIDDE
ncbi:MAG: site-2 protease family protein [Gemmataceae bacterium]